MNFVSKKLWKAKRFSLFPITVLGFGLFKIWVMGFLVVATPLVL